MKQVGEYLYTINESSQRVSTWKIREVNGNRYVCERRRTDRICEFVEGDPDIFETEEAAMQVIKKAKRKRDCPRAPSIITESRRRSRLKKALQRKNANRHPMASHERAAAREI